MHDLPSSAVQIRTFETLRPQLCERACAICRWSKSDAIRPGASSGDPRADPTLPRLADSCRSAAAVPPLLRESIGPPAPR